MCSGQVLLLLAWASGGLPHADFRDDAFVTDNIHSGWHIKRV
jgi:hypothetical protein